MNPIVIADDNAVNRELVREILEDAGYQVVEAQDGVELLSVMAVAHPILVLLDIQMPRMDGFEALSHIRGSDQLSGVKVVALTASVMAGDREKAMMSGFDAFLAKPIERSEFLRVISHLLAEPATVPVRQKVQ